MFNILLNKKHFEKLIYISPKNKLIKSEEKRLTYRKRHSNLTSAAVVKTPALILDFRGFLGGGAKDCEESFERLRRPQSKL
ncbi:hypothetical protein NC652_028699 [Populus alba x Populus x berolinensis]|nr:hypothetical protein NC652_028699 [Populus alba x Populus x berolinensis]